VEDTTNADAAANDDKVRGVVAADVAVAMTTREDEIMNMNKQYQGRDGETENVLRVPPGCRKKQH
jgi:hypothetical protein